MNYPVDTPMQLRSVLRALRQSRALTQEQVGKLLGVNQRRAARIEGNPAVTSFGQISRLVSALGGRLAIEVPAASETSARANASQRPGKRATTARMSRGEW